MPRIVAATLGRGNPPARLVHNLSGEEWTPDKDAEQRVHASGSFAAGEETTPKEDAKERVHPGTFADTEPEAEPTA
jgi:hypothetical protein